MGTVAVLGLGESLSLYKGGMMTIGVNDIWSRVKTDYIVCLDKRDKFTPERLFAIDNSRTIGFYTHIDEWKDRQDYIPIELQVAYPEHVCQLDIKTLPKSLCSPFVACVIAYKFHNAKEIHLYGVDLVNHPHLKDISLTKIRKHFINLQEALMEKGSKIIVHGEGILKDL